MPVNFWYLSKCTALSKTSQYTFIEANEYPVKTLNTIANQELHHRDKSNNAVLKNDDAQKV